MWTEEIGAISHIYKYDFENQKMEVLDRAVVQCPGMEMARTTDV
jgi:hypothetical protein